MPDPDPELESFVGRSRALTPTLATAAAAALHDSEVLVAAEAILSCPLSLIRSSGPWLGPLSHEEAAQAQLRWQSFEDNGGTIDRPGLHAVRIACRGPEASKAQAHLKHLSLPQG